MSALGAADASPGRRDTSADRHDRQSRGDGSIEPVVASSATEPAANDGLFLPDFCAARMVFAVVLLAELLAVVFALARPAAAFLTELARISLFIQWIALTSAALLCYVRPRLARLPVPWSAATVFALLLLDTALISEITVWLGRNWLQRGVTGTLFPLDHWPFLLRNSGICLIVTAMLLRYFFVAHQWRRHVRAEARSRLDALQARIRPHFLFNSLNTIASLTRTDPERAEEAVEDLAELFRATLRDSERPLLLQEELELARMYQRIEELRLGQRLAVRWEVAELPMRSLIPGLTIQPLLENAIYHGIEPLDQGGTVTVAGRVDGKQIAITVSNPVAPAPAEAPGAGHAGNRLALENIQQRLRLAYGDRASLAIEHGASQYRVTLRFPLEESSR
jgi:two-component system sensor histidine kinase AlgZ